MIRPKKHAFFITFFLFLLLASLSVMPIWSDVIVPYWWLVPGAYARYSGYFSPYLFYPNHTGVNFWPEQFSAFLEWTVVDRHGDFVQLNVTFHVEGNALIYYSEIVPDGKVDIRDVAVVARAFGNKVYEYGYDSNADVTGPDDEPDGKVDIRDVSFVAKAFGTSIGDPRWNSKADIAPEENRRVSGYWVHHKTILLDINIYSRETFLNGKSLGKTCFWAEPYLDVGDTVVLYTLPEEIVGTVREIDEEWAEGWGWHGITTSEVQVFQLDPFAWFAVYFDWYTGMTMKISLLGDATLHPEGDYSFGFPNGTEYKITRFANSLFGRALNLGGPDEYPMTLNYTNVKLGPPA
jgi:hypothetical protein